VGDKLRIEIIAENIISGGSIEERNAAWEYLRSESARSEAQMITVSHEAQMNVIAEMSKIKAKDLAEYQTNRITKKIQKILEQMIGDSRDLATIMITSNVMAGKIHALSVKKISGQAIIKKIELTDLDRDRVTRMVDQIIGRLQTGASLTMTSVKNTIQNAAIKANMVPSSPAPKTESDKDKKDKDKNKDKEEAQPKDDVEQSPISREFNGEQIEQKQTKKFKQSLPTSEELKELRKDPLRFSQNAAKKNVSIVTQLRNAYYQLKNSPLNSASDREKSKKELENGSQADRVAFGLGETLRKQGLFAFVDKGGKRWTLENYCAMTTRTVAQQSTNLGQIFAQEEHDLYYIVPHTGSCPLCAKYEGRVYSRSGKNPKYPPLSSAFSKIDPNGSDDLDNTYWTIHPNCRHKIIRYVEKAHTQKQQKEMQQKSAQPFELTKQQEEDQRYYKERERVWNERQAALSEFKMYLQIMPPKDVCGNFIKFYEHKKANDEKYKSIKKKYEELTK
jgi:hypothetical protein